MNAIPKTLGIQCRKKCCSILTDTASDCFITICCVVPNSFHCLSAADVNYTDRTTEER